MASSWKHFISKYISGWKLNCSMYYWTRKQIDPFCNHPLIWSLTDCFFPGKLLDGVLVDRQISSHGDTDHVIKVYLLRLLAGTDAKRLPWSKKVGTVSDIDNYYMQENEKMLPHRHILRQYKQNMSFHCFIPLPTYFTKKGIV